ncbi:hypothetical protein HID58_044829 [Brassica napus]|uniref:Uncharacterized protein n=1 Tax=Brassica napus TaxID=3708 RepID=A0ABQ7XI44_BRANA|nr:hypothetical protein HID58_044829 [Brassica napus]
MKEIMAGKHGRKKPTQKKSGNSQSARENVAPVVEEHVEEQSDGNNRNKGAGKEIIDLVYPVESPLELELEGGLRWE